MVNDLNQLYAGISKPDGRDRPEPARLFPVLSEISKEGRVLSIFLACFSNVPAFGRILLRSLDAVKVLASSEIETYTEVSFDAKSGKSGDRTLRPVGLIVVKNLKGAAWTALVDARVANNKLEDTQVSNYVELADSHKIDAVITISNDFAAVPHHHPVFNPAKSRRKPKARVYHWSWTSIRTHAELMLHTEEFENSTHKLLIQELTRFLSHPSSGVKRFEKMAGDWAGLLEALKRKGPRDQLDESSEQVVDAVASWHQETRDLALQLSSSVKDHIEIKMSREAKNDSQARIAADASKLASDDILEVGFNIRNAAAPLSVVVDLRGHWVSVGMKLPAHGSRKTMKGQIGWLRQQLKNSNPQDITIYAYWGKNKKKTVDRGMAEVFQNPEILDSDVAKGAPTNSEMRLNRLMRTMGAKNFISTLEEVVPYFYEQVGEKLKAWQPPPPKISKDRAKETKDQAIFEESSIIQGSEVSERNP